MLSHRLYTLTLSVECPRLYEEWQGKKTLATEDKGCRQGGKSEEEGVGVKTMEVDKGSRQWKQTREVDKGSRQEK